MTAAEGLQPAVMMMMMMTLEKGEGAVMPQGGVPSLPSAVTTHRLIDLPTTLPFKMTFSEKKKVTLLG